MEETKQVRRSDLETDGVKFIFRGGPKDGMTKESKRVIRAILSAIEEYTDYNDLDPIKKKVVRSTILDNVNNMKRVALLYVEAQERD